MTVPSEAPCACGHSREHHDHYRSGTDCGTCGRQVCPSFRPTARVDAGAEPQDAPPPLIADAPS